MPCLFEVDEVLGSSALMIFFVSIQKKYMSNSYDVTEICLGL
ncbi:hypothetical protein B0I21_103240 [Sphingobacterium paludis]|uniref:Uncharacterized protein n=1 Tax=Sphingobacterium paludis TaxID=1476465 RepID=A0A4R7D3N3_9SPHI|nr:hypothetical protein B0I21_103240 [Sphingobacterium paludis]